MDPERYPHHWANRFAFLLRKRLVERFVQHGHRVTAEEWAVLLILQVSDGLTMTELSDRTFRDRTTVTRMADRLVRKEWVRRQSDPQDRRTSRLFLTPEGRRTFATLAPIAQNLIARTLQGVASDDIDVTVRTLARMTAALSHLPDENQGHAIQL